MTPLDAHTIKQAPVFASLTEDEAVGLGQAMHDELAQAGQVLFLEGEPGDRFYVVLDGRVEIVKALGTQEERLLSIRGPGDYFGEMSLLDPAGLRTATVRALDPARLLSLSRHDFVALLHKHPILAYEMARYLTLQLRNTNDATIDDLRRKNQDLTAAYAELKAALRRSSRRRSWSKSCGLPVAFSRASSPWRSPACPVMTSAPL